MKEKETNKVTNQEDCFFVLTGNPFVDAGIYAIEVFYEKDFSDLSVEELESKIDALVNLYMTNGWAKNLFSIFTANSKFSNPSITDKRGASKEYLLGLLNDFSFPKSLGTCIACGRRDASPTKRRDHVPLTGSGKSVNFFAGGSEGERYCSVCTFAVQFIPLTLYKVGNRFLLLHSVSSRVMKYWAQEGIKNVNMQMATGNFSGCMEEGFKNSENALFNIVEKIIRNQEDLFSEENPSITAYVFSNYGQNPPPMQIISLPNNVFKFLVYIQRLNAGEWAKIVQRGYLTSKNEDYYKKVDNRVYKDLLVGVPIIKFFIEKDRSIIGNWELLSYYLKEVMKMDDKRVEVLKRVGDQIANYIATTDDTKKLFAIETAKSYEGLRNIFLKITKSMIKCGMSAPLFTVDEYVGDLFPDGAQSWKETRDILLFRIYEDLADYLSIKKEEIKEVEEEEEE